MVENSRQSDILNTTLLFEYLSNYLPKDNSRDEMLQYLTGDFNRFVKTIQLLPDSQGHLLEIGSSPYFTSLLIKKLTQYESTCINYFGADLPLHNESGVISGSGEKISFPYLNINFEEELPASFTEKYDVVLFCEVIEHLIRDPLFALKNIQKVLKKDGYLILTTPNVARFGNRFKILTGQNIYDPYSGYGIYGRHNREYTLPEIISLLTAAGFKIETAFTADVHQYDFSSGFVKERINNIVSLVTRLSNTMGQYIFIRAKNREDNQYKRPEWLYRSYLEE